MIDNKPPVGASPSGWHSIEAGWRCEKEYQYKHVRKIYSPHAQTPDYFAVGLCFHAGRARWFSRNFGTDDATWSSIKDAIQEEADRQKLPVSLNAERQALALMLAYVEHYSKLPLPVPVATEYTIGPAAIDRQALFYRTARLDDVSRYPEGGDALWIGEAKTTGASIADCENEYDLHGQILLQALLWKVAPQGAAMHGPAAGVMLDVVVKPGRYSKEIKFARKPIIISDRTLVWFATNLKRVLQRVSQIDWNTDADRDVTQCTRMYGTARIACEYRELCKHGRVATGMFVYGEDGKSLLSWKPTEEHRIAPYD